MQTVIALVLLLAVAAYSCGGGTDYGAGIWDLLAGRHERSDRHRTLVDYAMAPVWEVNNVWLVFVLVVTWTGFPRVFADVFSAAWVSLTLAIFGLILRGVGFAFRKPVRHFTGRRRWSTVFGVASILTPFFFAATLGGIPRAGSLWAAGTAICSPRG
jgi:cytochrome d ubiquinol oxidase subunit II